MMRKNMWMMAAILICGVMMMLTSCSKDDNATGDGLRRHGKES